ncbi:hypothetical protein GF339_17245 [candidate division KSB3 bacterium]|uniref:Rubrerythrin diiron-binding domain-containing protein n=1 Tax=candidate division KSB3 bacterium TaxID=2044937 RepID=A0A9D5JXX0_9BACT|nr:hypothetical protein [candidate division KSB3 bacterium]MBD3326334.1 hypothetical protein [candidate division KSB3 bacterium]
MVVFMRFRDGFVIVRNPDVQFLEICKNSAIICCPAMWYYSCKNFQHHHYNQKLFQEDLCMASFQNSYLTIEEFIKAAVRFEVESAEFYRALKDRTNDAQIEELLGILADEEVSHQHTLEEFEVPKESSGIIQFSPPFTAAMPEVPSELPDTESCIELGLQRERKSVELYEHAAGRVIGDFQQILEGLADFERQHIEKLLKIQKRFT